MTTTSPLQEALRDAARALQNGRWQIGKPDLDAAGVLGDQLWAPFQDALEAEAPDPDRVRAHLKAVPAACVAALQVPASDRFAELLRMVPQALADVEQDQAVRLLGQFASSAVCLDRSRPPSL
ncbi:hypothetical protein AB0D14_35455 [Streptomyces sp. NPDC048484]|uniref:hypothetical protein n=1 Tax=Streptomyces sp. NPDC048484 TaxID=3155146 RepID=UPI00344753DB